MRILLSSNGNPMRTDGQIESFNYAYGFGSRIEVKKYSTYWDLLQIWSSVELP